MEVANLSIREQKRRQFILHGDLVHVILKITFPLAVYAFFNFLYGFFDMIMVSSIGSNELASVVFIDEIKTAITAFGVGIAAAGTVIVAKEYGAGNMDAARKNAGASFILAFLVSAGIVVLTLVFGRQFLKFLNAPDELIASGLAYFNIQMITTALMAVNGVFIGLEKAKGNSTLILVLNIVAMSVKLILSATFVYGMSKGTEYVAFATLIAQGLLMIAAIFVMFGKKNSLRIKLNELNLKKEYVVPILLLAFPVFSGKFLFSMGKVFVNSIAAVYGPLAIAAFGIALKLGGGAGSLANVFEESETGIVSQNLGAKNLKRAADTGRISVLFCLITAVVGTVATVLLLPWLVPLFITNADPALETMAEELFRWEKYSIITSGLLTVIAGFFIGFKQSNVSFFLHIIRLFAFRLPVLWIMQRVGIGYEALGYAMFISNTATLIVGGILFFGFLHRIQNYGYRDLIYENVPNKSKISA